MRHSIAMLSLIRGWLPLLVQVAAVAALVGATARRSPRWRRRWLPAVTVFAVVVSVLAWGYVGSVGVAAMVVRSRCGSGPG